MNQPNFSDDENREDHSAKPTDDDRENPRHESSEKVNSLPLNELDDTVDFQSAVRPSAHEVPIVADLVGKNIDNFELDENSNAIVATIPGLNSSAAERAHEDFQNMAALGGAYGALAIGIWSIICSFVTYYSFIIALLAMILGFYGMGSSRRRLAIIGIALGVFGLLLALGEVSESLNFNTNEEA